MKTTQSAWRRRLSVATFVVGCGVAGATGSAWASPVVPPPPTGGPSADSPAAPTGQLVTPDPGGASSNASVGISSRQSGGNAGQSLPITGGDVLGLAAIGVGAIAAGGSVLAARRRFASC